MKADTSTCIVLMMMLLAISFSFASIVPSQSAERDTITLKDWSAHSLIHIRGAATSAPAGLSPTQIRTAYNLPSMGGQGTIAIVNAYDDPTVLNDLNVFSNQFGLPPLNNANFEKHMMAPRISTDSGWALETSLDVQWAHAIAPSAKILLVEATSNSLTSLLSAVDYARNRPDVVAISMSWGGSEFSTESRYDYHFTSPYGAVFFASSGDSGAGVLWPAVSVNVVGVGGTRLNFGAGGSVASETAWSGSGGGISAYESEPSYQVSYSVPSANGKRCVPDVSYDADPSSGVAVYDSTPYSGRTGWWQVGGTSAGAPQWAAIQALGLSTSNNNFYQTAKSANNLSYFRDITSGSNGAYTATTGYDCVTGLGSPITTNFALTATPDFSISASPPALTVQAGYSGSATMTVTTLNGFSGTVSLVASAPAGLTVDLSPSSFALMSGGSNSSTLSIAVLSTTSAGTYTVTVTGTNGSLSHFASLTVNVTTLPSAPSSLGATAGSAQVALSWNAPSSDGGSAITNYSVYKGTASGTETLLATMDNVLTYTDTAVTNGQTYYYQVTARNSVGESQKSNEAYSMPSSAKTLNSRVVTDKATYSRGATVVTTATIKDSVSGNLLRGALARVTFYYPSGSVMWTGYGTTSSAGTVRFDYWLGRWAPTGTYRVAVTVSYTGYQAGTGQTTFNVS